MRSLPIALPVFTLERAPIRDRAWNLASLSGRLVELSAAAAAAHLTAAFGLVLEAQLCGNRAAWITLQQSSFYPPDVADGGVDLDALSVVRVADLRLAGRAADHLVRSGGFGRVALDLPSADGVLPVPLLTRLLGSARQQDAVVLILTKKPSDTSSLHSVISLRAEAQRLEMEGRYELQVRVLKDKRGGPGWGHSEVCRGPAGLR